MAEADVDLETGGSFHDTAGEGVEEEATGKVGSGVEQVAVVEDWIARMPPSALRLEPADLEARVDDEWESEAANTWERAGGVVERLASDLKIAVLVELPELGPFRHVREVDQLIYQGHLRLWVEILVSSTYWQHSSRISYNSHYDTNLGTT
jgi:hypothetical protein